MWIWWGIMAKHILGLAGHAVQKLAFIRVVQVKQVS